jgi:hypothetical protein
LGNGICCVHPSTLYLSIVTIPRRLGYIGIWAKE